MNIKKTRSARPASSVKSSRETDLVPRLKNQGYDAERVRRRREWVEDKTGSILGHVGSFSADSQDFRGNIENPIGIVQVPLGVAGPLEVRGQYAQGTFYVPLATSEGALVRSYERGMVALTRAGGVETSVVRDGNQISPSFFFANLSEATAFVDWLPRHFSEIKGEAESTTRHGKLDSIHSYLMGRQVIVNFSYETGDAQGMNLLVKATDQACRWIEERYPLQRYFLFSLVECARRSAPPVPSWRGGRGNG